MARRGHNVLGLDLSPYMIEQARLRAGAQRGSCTFEVGDATTLDLGRKFELIVCVTVLQHILDPAEARAAVARLAAHLAPGGALILLEAAPTHATSRCDTAVFRARTIEWYRDALRAAGMVVAAQMGVDPMPFKTWLLPYYRRLPAPIATVLLALVTALALPLDWALHRWSGNRSWHKVIVAKHTQTQGAVAGRGARPRAPI
jgi:SAM-dependent methyltransferase